MPQPNATRRLPLLAASLALLVASGCRHQGFPQAPAGYREYAYIANAGSNTVSVLDLVALRPERTLDVGAQPTALAANPLRNEIYVVNTEAGTISVVDADALRVTATIPVHRMPHAIAIEPAGHRAYVANAGSRSISFIDLDQRREIAEVATTGEPGPLSIAPDARTLLVTYRDTGSVAIFALAQDARALPVQLRATFSGCPGAAAAVILPNSSKAFIACSGGHQVMALGLASPATPVPDRLLTMLDVGVNPTYLALKPDGGEIFVANTLAGSVSEIATETNEVGGTTMIGNRPYAGIVSGDNSTLFVANSGDDAIGLYSIDDGKLVSSLHTGSAPGAMAFSADEHLLLALDTRSGDVSVVRTQGRLGPNLFTILPAGSGPSAIVTKVVDNGGKF